MGTAHTSVASTGDPTMLTALQAATLGHRGANPLVGAVLVDHEGEKLAVGHHRGAGTLHAERDAILRARESGVTDFSRTALYTTLEPCRHHGRQPACTEIILDAGIGTVVCAAEDPTVNGGGAEVLAEAGVAVTTGVHQADADRLNHRWNLAQRQHRPFVTIHLAQSLDARIAAADGTSQWITSPASRQHTHRIRQRVDAILVGTNTLAIDDPRLTARNSEGEPTPHQPLRCVMGKSEVLGTAAITQGQADGDGWRHLRTRDPLEALATLSTTHHNGHPIKHVLVEGGQSVLSAFVAADLVDEIFVYTAPLILGSGRSSLGDISVTTLEQAPRYVLDPSDGGPLAMMEDDVFLHLTPAPKEREL